MLGQAVTLSTRFMAGATFVLAGLVTSHEAAACSPPSGSAPGWFVEVYQLGVKTDGLMPAPVIDAFPLTQMPVRFGDLPGIRKTSNIYKFKLKGNWTVCEAGRYELSLVVEAAPNNSFDKSTICAGHMEQGTARIFDLAPPGSWKMIEKGTRATTAGVANMEVGVHPISLEFACGVQFYGGATTMMKGADEDYWNGVFTVRVRGPNDASPHEFSSSQIFQRPR